MSAKEKFLWSVLTAVALALIFFLLLQVYPKIKVKQSANKSPQRMEIHAAVEPKRYGESR
jgi:ABC-type dipeptide/oligopeptide/nickel transport system permease component